MAEKYDGSIVFDTRIDDKGMIEGIKSLQKTAGNYSKSVAEEIDHVNDTLDEAVSKSNELNESMNFNTKGIQNAKDEINQLSQNVDYSVDSLEGFDSGLETLESNVTDTIATIEDEYSYLDDIVKNAIERANKAAEGFLGGGALYEKTEIGMSRLATSTDSLKESMESLSQKTDDTGNSMGAFGKIAKEVFKQFGIDADKAIDSIANGLKRMDDKVDSSKGKVDSGSKSMALSFDIVTGAALGLAAGVAKIGFECMNAADKVELSTTRMQVALGLTSKEAEEVSESVQKVYQKGLVENREEAEQAITSVIKLMGAQGEEAEDLANKLTAIAKGGFGADFNSAARTASTLMRQFGLTGSEALDLIVAGLQSAANKNDDLLDVFNEYAPSFKRLGYSANEFLSSLISAADSGAYSVDKAAGVVKEFYNQAASGSTDFAEALSDLGFNSERTIEIVLSGGDKSKKKFEEISHRLASVGNETRKAQIASKLFGTQWEDVGTKATLALSNTNQKIIETAGKSEEAFKQLTSNTETFLSGAGRMLEGFFSRLGAMIVNFVLPGIGSIIQGVKDIAGFSSRGYASGTLSAPRGRAWVGENGPELVEFRGGERVYNATQSRAMMAASNSTSVTYVTNYNNFPLNDLKALTEVNNYLQNQRQDFRMGYSGR